MKKNLIFITGSEGFIGSHLKKQLSDVIGYDIAISNALDINDSKMLYAAIHDAAPKIIVHLAAVSNRQDVDKDPELALKTNIIGSFNVMRIAHKYHIPVIIASSAATLEPESSLYAMTKMAMESLAWMFEFVTIARFYNVYGPGSKSVVNKFVKRIRLGREIVLYGNTKRDYIHVDDLVESLISLINAQDRPKSVNIGTGRTTSLNKIVSIIEKELDKKAMIKNLPPVNEIQESRCTVPYGTYKITLEQGIRRMK